MIDISMKAEGGRHYMGVAPASNMKYVRVINKGNSPNVGVNLYIDPEIKHTY